MLIHHLSGRPSEWCLASHHYPESYAKRIQIRADVCTDSRELLWTGKFGGPSKGPRGRERTIDKCSVFAESLSDPDVGIGDSANVDSSSADPRRIQTGHIPLSLMAENFVPQVGQVRISRRANPPFLLGSFPGSAGPAFTA